MITILSTFVSALSFRLRSRASLELELIALRHQVSVLRRQHKGRLRLFATDRLLWVWLYRIWPRCLDATVLVKPATVIQWHRKGFRLYWRRRSRPLGRPKKSTKIRNLIRWMSMANPLWGAPRIHGELLKLGIAVCQATVGRYMPWRPKVPSPHLALISAQPQYRGGRHCTAIPVAERLCGAHHRLDPPRMPQSHHHLR